MDNTQLKETLKNHLDTIFGMLDIEYTVEFEEIPEENKICVNISSQNDSLLVGYHANNLNSLQHITNIFINKDKHGSESENETEGHQIIIIDIGGYRKNREIKLKEMAKEVADKAKELGKSIGLYPMSSYERRIIHEAISAIDGVTSYSEGEGAERKIIVSLKKEDEI
jgi:spoIIIJ-associated protein